MVRQEDSPCQQHGPRLSDRTATVLHLAHDSGATSLPAVLCHCRHADMNAFPWTSVLLSALAVACVEYTRCGWYRIRGMCSVSEPFGQGQTPATCGRMGRPQPGHSFARFVR